MTSQLFVLSDRRDLYQMTPTKLSILVSLGSCKVTLSTQGHPIHQKTKDACLLLA